MSALRPLATDSPFSETLRTATIDAHRAAERSPFIRNLLTGRLPRRSYAQMTGQLYALYSTLEELTGSLAGDPVVGAFLADELIRVPSLEDDLRYLGGDDWTSLAEPMPSTGRYIDRLRELSATWPTGIVAHHYLRYLGDLSGGQIIARLVRRAYGLEDDGVRFYRFDRIADIDAFKAAYRGRLDAGPWDPAERERLIDEVNLGYRFAREMFDELGEAAGPIAPG
jgi:heme oxygenase